MSFSADVVGLFLYVVQQLGMLLGVGAQTILLSAFVLAARDGTIREDEARFARRVGGVLKAGLLLIVLSGAAVTLLHFLGNQFGIILLPAFLFKWALIASIVAVVLAQGRRPYPHYLLEGLAGALWYVLLAVHVTAPLTSWATLLLLSLLGISAFLLAWVGIVFATRTQKEKVVITEDVPRPVAPSAVPRAAAPLPQRAAPAPVPQHKPLPQVVLTPHLVKPAVTQAAPAPHKPHPLPEVLSEQATFPAPHKAAPPVAPRPAPAPHKPVPVPAARMRGEEMTLEPLRVMPRSPEETLVQA